MLAYLRLRWWLVRLQSPLPRLRRAACERLGELNDPSAVDPLVERLGDAHAPVSAAAQSALQQLRNSGVEMDPETEALVDVLPRLNDPDWHAREEACGRLGHLGDARTVVGLAERMGDASARVRRAAAAALVALAPRSPEALLACLSSPRAQVRQAACTVLPQTHSDRCAALLVRRTRDPEAKVRLAALSGLSAVGAPSAFETSIRALRDDDWRVRRLSARALGKLGDPRAVQPLAKLVDDSSQRVRTAACRALGALGSAARGPLMVGFDDRNPEVRRAACTALAEVAGAEATEALLARLGDGDWTVRRAAARALGKLADDRAFEPLIEALGDSSSRVRRAAVRALSAFGGRSMQPFLERLVDPDPSVRRSVCDALAESGSADAVEPLLSTLGDEDGEVRKSAAAALAALGEEDLSQAIARLTAGDEQGLRALARLAEEGDRRAVVPLMTWTKWSNSQVRRAACLGLGACRDTRATDFVRQRLSDDDPHVRAAACIAAGQLRDARARRTLRKRLADRSAAVRKAACKALGALGDANDVEPLAECLSDASSGVRAAAGEALTALGEAPLASAVLGTLAGDPVAADLLRQLKEVGDPRALKPLAERLADDDWQLRKAACDGLAALGRGEAVDPLIERLGDERDEVREAASEALCALGAGRFVDEVSGALGLSRLAGGVLGALRRQRESREALVDLARRGDVRAAIPLIARLDDPDPVVFQGAREALVALGPHATDALLRAAQRNQPPSLLVVADVLRTIHEQFDAQTPQMLCRTHFTRFRRESLSVDGVGAIRCVACRVCGQATGAILDVEEVVARLDNRMTDSFVLVDGVAYVNWLQLRQPCDFDRLEILAATDREVEELCLVAGNDTDASRARRYPSIPCALAAGLSAAAVNMVDATFGEVADLQDEERKGSGDDWMNR